MKTTFITLGCIFSWLIFWFGIIAPLTPSVGTPKYWELLIFVGLPLTLLTSCWYKCNDPIGKYLMIGQGLLIIIFSSGLLAYQLGVFD
ncbi:MAG: hypothetical protein ACQ9MH_10965 [Nitrospinales bacterium]